MKRDVHRIGRYLPINLGSIVTFLGQQKINGYLGHKFQKKSLIKVTFVQHFFSKWTDTISPKFYQDNFKIRHLCTYYLVLTCISK